MWWTKSLEATVIVLIATALFGFIKAQSIGSKDLYRCRQSCYQKFVQDWHHCMDFDDCKSCWNNCDQQLGPFPLNINSALRQGSLVLTDIAWDQAITNASKQCLVTWEVSGGGLMGNLLTDSSSVELSLWPDTVYHVQVTCKHKETGGMRRSFNLIVDTHKLSDSTATGMQAITIEGEKKSASNIFATEQSSSGEKDSRMRILKDSSNDFLSPYNPNANDAISKSAMHKKASTRINVPTTTTTESDSILRTRIVDNVPADDSTDYLTQSIVFAIVGALVVFFGLLITSVLIRPDRKNASADMANIDKQNLIRREILPSQTPVVVAQSSRSLTTIAKDSSHNAESRTLHV